LSFDLSVILADADDLFHILGQPCDPEGEYLAPDASPKVPQTLPPERCGDDWTPFDSEAAFRTAKLLFVDAQMSQGHLE
jgi:hypothetical protein